MNSKAEYAVLTKDCVLHRYLMACSLKKGEIVDVNEDKSSSDTINVIIGDAKVSVSLLPRQEAALITENGEENSTCSYHIL